MNNTNEADRLTEREEWRGLIKRTFRRVKAWRKYGYLHDDTIREYLHDLYHSRDLAIAANARDGGFLLGYCWGRLDAVATEAIERMDKAERQGG